MTQLICNNACWGHFPGNWKTLKQKLASYPVSLVPANCASARLLQQFPNACYITEDDVMPKSLLEVEPVLA